MQNSFSNLLPEFGKALQRILPLETPLDIYVRDVEYIENGCARLSGTLYLTVFRLLFVPDKEVPNEDVIVSGHKYISKQDIPLASIYKIDDTPVNVQMGFKSFLTNDQIVSEAQSFTVTTRDFREITFSKRLVMSLNPDKHESEFSSHEKMDTYIRELKAHSRVAYKTYLYPYLATKGTKEEGFDGRVRQECRELSRNRLVIDPNEDSFHLDLSVSTDERIRAYMTVEDWYDELNQAKETGFIVNRKKFNSNGFIRKEGPYIYLATVDKADDTSTNLIWHWTHTSEVKTVRYRKQSKNPEQFMLATLPGIIDNISGVESLYRNGTRSYLTYSIQTINKKTFQRYNLTKFPCNLQTLQTSYEKLIQLCVASSSDSDDDDKWLSKLNACKWLKYISKALHGAALLAKLLNRTNILLVGSDIDNSCLMSSLIQVMLRPKCRTIKGFCELIVREWLVCGHPFCERFGQVSSDMNGNNSQEGPVFLLFLDCIHQLINQNPFSFEFTEYFLIELYHDVCYCYHHTFAFNSVTERIDAIQTFPDNMLFLSSFDFMLYLHPSTIYLLKNYSYALLSQRSSSSRRKIIQLKPSKGRCSSVNRSSQSTKYRLESPKPSRFVLDIAYPPSPKNRALPNDVDHFEYDVIQSPQVFYSNFSVDWRDFNIVLWSKCYCRYDGNFMPTLCEQQLLSEIDRIQQDIAEITMKSRRYLSIDVFHNKKHANSWHPKLLNTRL